MRAPRTDAVANVGAFRRKLITARSSSLHPPSPAPRERAGAIHAAALAFAAFAFPALAQPVSFQGKTITILVTDGGYATYSRALAEHMPKHLPGRPTMIVKDMPGAGSLVAAHFIYEAAQADGTQISVVSGTTATAKLFRLPNIRFDPRRYKWIGSVTSDVGVVISGAQTSIRSIQDVFERKMLVGGGGATSGNVIFPTLMNRLLGTKFEIIKGYRSSDMAGLAMQRGEVEGVASWNWTGLRSGHEHLLRENQIRLLLQLSLRRHPDMPEIPTVLELTKTDEQRAVVELVFASQSMARPFIAPPATPPDVANALRRGFEAMLKDPEFRATAERYKLEINNPMTGEEVQALVEKLHGYPEAIVEKAVQMTKIEE